MKNELTFSSWKKEILKNPKIKAEFLALEPEFAVINAIIEARTENQLTQKELAHKMGTTQSVISRLESGNANPSVSFLQKLAKALGKNVEIRFVQPLSYSI